MDADNNGQSFQLHADVEQKLLVREIDDADALVEWHNVKTEVEQELHGFQLVSGGIANDRHLSDEGKRSKVAEAREGYLHRLGVLETQVIAPLRQEISKLEEVFTAPTGSPTEAVLHYLKLSEIRSQLSRLSAGELDAAYLTALDEDDEEVCQAIKQWPGRTLSKSVPGMITLLPKEKTEAGKRQRLEKKYPAEAARLAKLKRLEHSYTSMLQAATHDMGGGAVDDTLERIARGDAS
jgi:hypothetical protein